MSRFPWRANAVRLALAVAALAVVAVAGSVLAAKPATATWTSMSGTPSCGCVLRNADNTQYKAVFGYDNPTQYVGRIEAGDNNSVYPKSAGGTPTTDFQPGDHPASFVTGWVDRDTTVAWNVGDKTATADWSKPTCGRQISLPATGNGSGPIVALAASLLIAAGVVLVRRRRPVLREGA
jgi:LPXTG-motif cell wall-anchored protein